MKWSNKHPVKSEGEKKEIRIEQHPKEIQVMSIINSTIRKHESAL